MDQSLIIPDNCFISQQCKTFMLLVHYNAIPIHNRSSSIQNFYITGLMHEKPLSYISIAMQNINHIYVSFKIYKHQRDTLTMQKTTYQNIQQ